MNIEEIRLYCLDNKVVTEGFPFDDTTLVFKVAGKMFALLSLDNHSLNLKCDPDIAIELREHYNAVLPGYHMNKKLWNTVVLDGSIPDNLIRDWIDNSYGIIVENLPQKLKRELL